MRRTLGLAAASSLVVALVPGVASAQVAPPGDRGTDAVCDGDYDRNFTDIAGSAHEDNVRCMADYGLTEGLRGGDTYGPRNNVNRGQMASFIARFVEEYTGEALPAGDPNRFNDVPASGYEHGANIHALAGVEIVEGTNASGGQSYAPNSAVTRAQMASFIRRALTYIDTGQAAPLTEPPPTANDYFGDDNGSTHEASINALAAVGIVEGRGAGEYVPNGFVFRDQMASFVMRAFDYAVTEQLGDGFEPPPDDEEGSISGTVTEPGTVEPGDTIVEAVTEDAYLQIGDNEFDLPGCPDGVPPEEGDECITLNGTIDGDGVVTVGPDGLSFPELVLELEDTDFGDIDVEIDISAPAGATGTFDPETGEMSLDTTLNIDVTIPGLTTCAISPVELELDTDSDGGAPIADGRGTLFDGSFAVPAATGNPLVCGGVSGELGLPSDAGDNEVSFDMLFTLTEGEGEPIPGDPIEGATVAIDGTDWSATTNADGEYSIDEVPPGSYSVTASAEGYDSETVDEVVVVDGEDTVLDFVLSETEPAPDVQVTLEGSESTVTDEPTVYEATISNEGDATYEGTGDIEFTIAGTEGETGEVTVEFSFEGSPYVELPTEEEDGARVVRIEDEDLTLEPDESVSVDVRITFDDADTYELTLATFDEDGPLADDSLTVTVTAPAPDVQVSLEGPEATVTDEPTVYEATISNEGDATYEGTGDIVFTIAGSGEETGDVTVEFSFDGSPYVELPTEADEDTGAQVVTIEDEDLTLEPGESVSVDVRITFDDADTYELTLATFDEDGPLADDSLTVAVTAPVIEP